MNIATFANNKKCGNHVISALFYICITNRANLFTSRPGPVTLGLRNRTAGKLPPSSVLGVGLHIAGSASPDTKPGTRGRGAPRECFDILSRRKPHEEVPFSGTGSGDDHVSGHRLCWCQGLHRQQQDHLF